MIEKMKQCKFLLMLLLLFIGMGAYAQNVVDSKNIFTETFDKMKGKGGNDGNFDVWGPLIGKLSSGDFDNAGWSHWGGSNGKADKCVRIEMSASLTTPALANLKGDAFLFFRAAQNRNAATSIDLSISGGGSLSENSVKLEKTFNDYVVLIKDATPETKVTFSCSTAGCFFLDNVKVNIDGTPTSIGSISGNASVEAAKVYTIDGQYVGNSTKGLKKGFYIVGGKKVLL